MWDGNVTANFYFFSFTLKKINFMEYNINVSDKLNHMFCTTFDIIQLSNLTTLTNATYSQYQQARIQHAYSQKKFRSVHKTFRSFLEAIRFVETVQLSRVVVVCFIVYITYYFPSLLCPSNVCILPLQMNRCCGPRISR